MRQLDALFEHGSSLTGTSPDQLKLIVILILSIPVSHPLSRLPASSNLTHVYNILVSYLFLTQVLYLHSGFLQLLGQCIGTWCAVKFCRSTQKSKMWTFTIFWANMALLTVNHFIRWYTNLSLDIVEITGPQMVLVMKLGLFAWAAYDGGRPAEKLDAAQLKERLVEVPGLLPFLGYCFYIPSFQIGPSFTYSAYAAYTDRSLFNARRGDEQIGQIPAGRTRRCLKRTAVATFYLAIYAVYGGKFSYERMIEPKFAHLSLLRRIGFVQLAGFMARTKYYAVWTFAEAGMILSGIAYDGETGKWSRGRNLRITQIETAQSFKTLLDAWNIGANTWLRECVYKRLAKPGKKPGFKSTMATFGTSAFWHGFNPTYYFTFVLGGFFQSLGRAMRTSVRPFVLPANYALLSATDKQIAEQVPTKRIYDVLSVAAVQVALNFIVIPFMLLEVRPTFLAWSRVHYYGLFLCFVPLAAFRLGVGKTLKQKQRQRAKQAGVTDEAVEKARQEAKAHTDKGATTVPNVEHALKDGLRRR